MLNPIVNRTWIIRFLCEWCGQWSQWSGDGILSIYYLCSGNNGNIMEIYWVYLSISCMYWETHHGDIMIDDGNCWLNPAMNSLPWTMTFSTFNSLPWKSWSVSQVRWFTVYFDDSPVRKLRTMEVSWNGSQSIKMLECLRSHAWQLTATSSHEGVVFFLAAGNSTILRWIPTTWAASRAIFVYQTIAKPIFGVHVGDQKTW